MLIIDDSHWVGIYVEMPGDDTQWITYLSKHTEMHGRYFVAGEVVHVLTLRGTAFDCCKVIDCLQQVKEHGSQWLEKRMFNGWKLAQVLSST